MKKMLLKTLLTGLALVFCSANAQAGITLISRTDTAEHLKVVWGWDPETADTYSDGAVNWSDYLTIDPAWNVSWGFQHLNGPHPTDIDPGTAFGTNASFGATDYGIVISESGSIIHPATDGTHRDDWTFTFDRSMMASNTTITLDVVHAVPEPGTIMLMGIGALGMFGMKHGKRREAEVA